MAYQGGIDYLYVRGKTMNWSACELASPWSRRVLVGSSDGAGDGADAPPPVVVEDLVEEEDEEEELTHSDADDNGRAGGRFTYDERDKDPGYEPKSEQFYNPDTWTSDPETVLSAVARDFTAHLTEEHESKLIYDVENTVRDPTFKCVVLGRQRTQGTMVKSHYILIVAPVSSNHWPGLAAVDRHRHDVYERVGVGVLPGRCIALQKKGLTVKIV